MQNNQLLINAFVCTSLSCTSTRFYFKLKLNRICNVLAEILFGYTVDNIKNLRDYDFYLESVEGVRNAHPISSKRSTTSFSLCCTFFYVECTPNHDV